MVSRAAKTCGVAASDEGAFAGARSRGREVARSRGRAGRRLRETYAAARAAYLAWSAIGCRNAEKPVSMICTPMHSSRNADTRFATFVPSLPR